MMNAERGFNPQEDAAPKKKSPETIHDAVADYDALEAKKADMAKFLGEINAIPGETAEQIADMKAIAAKSDAAKISEVKRGITGESDQRDALLRMDAERAAEKSMDKRRLEALQQELRNMEDVIKMKYNVDVVKQSTQGLGGRVTGGFRSMFNPGLRAAVGKYQETLARFNNLSTQADEQSMTPADWSKRADRAGDRRAKQQGESGKNPFRPS
jgi:hypothetical protein